MFGKSRKEVIGHMQNPQEVKKRFLSEIVRLGRTRISNEEVARMVQEFQNAYLVSCSGCGVVNLLGEVYCSECGKPLPLPKNLEQLALSETDAPPKMDHGDQKKEGHKFCVQCGAKL